MSQSTRHRRSWHQPASKPLERVLRLKPKRLVGREVETQVLYDAFERTTSNNHREGSSEFVVVSGKSGVGKTALVRVLEQFVMEGPPPSCASKRKTVGEGLFCSGKFDKNTHRRPYAAFVDAIESLLRLLRRTRSWEPFKKRIRSMGSLAFTLSGIFPGLDYVLDDDAKASSEKNSKQLPLERLSELVRSFLRTVSDTLKETLVLHLDDIHLADASTLDLLTYLVADTQSKNILHLWTYRSDAITDDHNLSKAFKEIERFKFIGQLEVNELPLESVNEILYTTTEKTPEETLPLAELVHKRTNGNCFFVWQFLQMLQETKMLVPSTHDYSWSWDLEAIQRGTTYSANVADFLIDRVHRLSPPCKKILRIAACFGSEFDEDLVFAIFQQPDEASVELDFLGNPLNLSDETMRIDQEHWEDFDKAKKSAFDGCMAELFSLGLIDSAPGGFNKFAHGRIQQLALDCEPSGEDVERLHLRIGTLLFGLRNSESFNSDWLFFSSIEQLNKGKDYLSASNRLALAKLNHRAAEVARKRSAFIIAASFLRSGIKMLRGLDMWNTHYDLCIELHSSAAEMEYFSSNYVKCNRLADCVFHYAKTVHDGFRALLVRAQALRSQGRYQEAVDWSLDTLELLGESFPRKVRLWHTVAAITKAKKLLRGKTDEELVSMPPMTDPAKISAMEMLRHLASFLFFLQDRSLLPLVYVRLLELSVEHGTSPVTSVAYVSYAMILCSMMDMEDAYRFGSLAFRLIDKADPATIPGMTVWFHVFMSHWRRPLRETLDDLLNGFEVGMDAGEIHYGMFSAGSYCSTYLASGLPLKPVTQDLRKFLRLMKDYKQHSTYLIHVPLLQYALNLMGEAEDPLVLTGEAMNQNDFLLAAKKETDQIAIRTLNHRLLALAMLFGQDLERTEELFVATTKGELEIKTSIIQLDVSFLGALLYMDLAQATGKNKLYSRKARQQMREIEKWVKKGNVNCLDLLQLLKAEHLSVQRKSTVREVRHAYNVAIQSSMKCGFIHNAALANERAAKYFLEQHDDMDWAKFYLARAADLYGEWGALGKVHKLEWEYEFLATMDLLDRSNTSKGSDNKVERMFVQGRKRFNYKVLDQHSRISFDDDGTLSTR